MPRPLIPERPVHRLIGMPEARRFYIRTFGCQMNEHDSERMKGMLDALGYEEAAGRDAADLILFNTCSIRESADNRFIVRSRLDLQTLQTVCNPPLLPPICTQAWQSAMANTAPAYGACRRCRLRNPVAVIRELVS